MENAERWNNLDQLEQHYFCESCHVLLWVLQVTIIDYLCYILDCCRVHCIDAEWVTWLRKVNLDV